jgi:hypothetical protein
MGSFRHERSIENLIFRGRPDAHNECDQWTLVKDADDDHDRRMTVAEFLATEQPPAVKHKLQTILDARQA